MEKDQSLNLWERIRTASLNVLRLLGRNFFQIVFFTTVFCATYFLFIRQAYRFYGRYVSDFMAHFRFTSLFFSGKMYLPHPGIHTICYYISKITSLPLQYSFSIVLALFATASAFIIYLILLRSLKGYYSPAFLTTMTGVLMVVSPVYAPFFNPWIYLMQGSPNVWHNPTLIAVKPFAFLSFLLMISFCNHTEYQKKIKYYFLISFIFLLSLWMKPNFVMSFFPAVAVWLLIKYPKRWDLYLKASILFLPSIVYLGYQYVNTFPLSNTKGIIIDFLGVWRLYSRNPYISLFLATAFPCLLILFRFKSVMNNPFFCVSSINLVIAVLQFMFFAESGKTYSHANFAWGYMIALQLMFIFAAIEYLKWLATGNKRGTDFIKIGVVTAAFGLHLFSGILYTWKIWSGGGYA